MKSKLVLLPSSATKEVASCEELCLVHCENDVFHPTKYKLFFLFASFSPTFCNCNEALLISYSSSPSTQNLDFTDFFSSLHMSV